MKLNKLIVSNQLSSVIKTEISNNHYLQLFFILTRANYFFFLLWFLFILFPFLKKCFVTIFILFFSKLKLIISLFYF